MTPATLPALLLAMAISTLIGLVYIALEPDDDEN